MMRIQSFILIFLLVLPACPGEDKPADTADTADTAEPECGSSMAEFCELELGGPCPSFEEASALFCEGVHLTTVDNGNPALVSDGDPSCDNPTVGCNPEVGASTHFYFEADGSGQLEAIVLDWSDTEECSGYRVFGELWC